MESMDLAASFCFFGGIQSMKNWVLLRKGGNFTELGETVWDPAENSGADPQPGYYRRGGF